MTGNKVKNINLIQGTIIYAIGSFGTKILSFLVVPLYTYYISKEDMGIYDLLNTTISLLTPIITLQISDAAFRWMIREKEKNALYIKSTMQVLVFNCLVAVLLIYVISKIHPFLYSTEFILLLVSSRALETVQKLLRGLKNQKLYVVSGVVYTVIFLVMNVTQICILKLGVRSMFISAIIANIIALVIVFLWEKNFRLNYLSKPNINLIKQLFRFSAPLVPNQLNWWVINSSDRYIISFFLGAAANGLYSIAYKFPSVLQLVLGFFNTAWQDVSVADSDSDSGEYYTMVFKQLYRFSFSLLWFVIPITKVFITLVMSQDYKSSSNYISFLYLGTVFQSFSSFYGVGYLRDKNTKQASITSIYGAIVNAVVNTALINFIGLQAGPISTFVGFFVMWIIREKQNRQELRVEIDKFDFLKFFIPVLLIAIIACFSRFYIDLIIGIMGCVGFLLINKSFVIQILKKTIH